MSVMYKKTGEELFYLQTALAELSIALANSQYQNKTVIYDAGNGLAKIWASLIQKGVYTKKDIPLSGNLKEVVTELVDSVERGGER